MNLQVVDSDSYLRGSGELQSWLFSIKCFAYFSPWYFHIRRNRCLKFFS